MSDFESRWLTYTPDQENNTDKPDVVTDKTDITPTLSAPIHSAAVPRLPWQLERLLCAAASGVLNVELKGVLDAGRYTLAYGCIYLAGDRDEALRQLWQVHGAWQEQVDVKKIGQPRTAFKIQPAIESR